MDASTGLTRIDTDLRFLRDELEIDIKHPYSNPYSTLYRAGFYPVDWEALAKPSALWNETDHLTVALWLLSRFHMNLVHERWTYSAISRLVEQKGLESALRSETMQHPDDVLFVVARKWFAAQENASRGRRDNQLILERLMHVAIEAGEDIHGRSRLLERVGTPLWCLLYYSASSYRTHEHALNTALRSWIDKMAEVVDLLEYGRTETQLWPWFVSRSESEEGAHPGHRIIYGFTYGKTSDQWHVLLERPGDRYAGIFWDALDHPERGLVGAWPELWHVQEQQHGRPLRWWDDFYFAIQDLTRERRRCRCGQFRNKPRAGHCTVASGHCEYCKDKMSWEIDTYLSG